MGTSLRNITGTTPIDIMNINNNFLGLWTEIANITKTKKMLQTKQSINTKIKKINIKLTNTQGVILISLPENFNNPIILHNLNNFQNKSDKIKVMKNYYFNIEITENKKIKISYDIDLISLKGKLINNEIEFLEIPETNLNIDLELLLIES